VAPRVSRESADCVSRMRMQFYIGACIGAYIMFTAPAMGSLDYVLGFVTFSISLIALALTESFIYQ